MRSWVLLDRNFSKLATLLHGTVNFVAVSFRHVPVELYAYLVWSPTRSVKLALHQKTIMPLITRCQNGDTSSRNRPLLSTPMIRHPSTVPRIELRPPESDVPPITTAAIESSSYPMPAFGSVASSRPVTISPATADSSPHSVYAASLILSTRNPVSNAARSLPPTAYKYLLNRV